jgi:hypothetical protein
MPIYMQVEGSRGDVSSGRAGSANGGVWKTTNFLTQDARSTGHVARPKIKVFIAPSDPSVVEISRISLTPSGGGVDGRDPAAKMQLDQLMNAARSHGPSGKLYVATDAGVFQNGIRIDGQGKLLVGTEGSIWRSGRIREAAANMKASNNLKQLGLGSHNGSVDIIVTDAGGTVVGTHRLRNVSVSGTSGTFTLTFNGQTTGGY